MKPLVGDPNDIRLASIGMVEGNGHPYSWSAILNGYDRDAMADCPYPAIPEYLGRRSEEDFGIRGARVTHIWCDNPADAERVAAAARIPTILSGPEEAIGRVDAVLIPTDKGEEHLERARPFIEAGLPVFIDKPLTVREDHLRRFVAWRNDGRAILSSSAMRYSVEYAALRERLAEVGETRFLTITTPKSWERYGIHALEGIYPFLPAGGWLSVANTGTETANIVHLEHETGVHAIVAAIADLYGAFGCLNVHGTKAKLAADFSDTFAAFKAQLTAFVDYLATGEPPFPFEETVELMKLVIAGIRSREQGGRKVQLGEIEA